MPKEIERKFIVTSNIWQQHRDAGSKLQQAYILNMSDRNARVRIIDGETAFLTIKIGKAQLSRDEFEYEIPLNEARDLIQLKIGNLITKTRHRVNFKGYAWEIDTYYGGLEGLVVAEVELGCESEKPDLPEWVGIELTGNPLYSNQILALEGLPKETTDTNLDMDQPAQPIETA